MGKLTNKKMIVIIIVELILALSCYFIAKMLGKNNYVISIIALFAILIILYTIVFWFVFYLNNKERAKKNILKDNKSDTTEYNPQDIFRLTTEITSIYNDGSGLGPRIITEYYLATKEDEDFYELFSKVKIEKEEDTHSEEFCCKNFNTPYITQVEPLTDYVKDPNKKLSADLLFAFITEVNADKRIEELVKSEKSNEENDDDSEEE